MEKKKNSQKANRILYTAVVAILCVVAIVIGIVAAANRSTEAPAPQGTNPPTGTQTPGPGDENGAPSDKPTEVPPEKQTEYLCPLAGSVSKKHDLENLSYSSTMGDWRTHAGMDIAASLGDTVSATADGVVKEIFEDYLMGHCISVEHEDGVVSIYRNMAEEMASGIAVGVHVKAGQALGVVGESAMREMADEPHLHFEMTVNGEPVDPLDYLSEESCEASLTFDDDTVYED